MQCSHCGLITWAQLFICLIWSHKTTCFSDLHCQQTCSIPKLSYLMGHDDAGLLLFLLLFSSTALTFDPFPVSTTPASSSSVSSERVLSKLRPTVLASERDLKEVDGVGAAEFPQVALAFQTQPHCLVGVHGVHKWWTLRGNTLDKILVATSVINKAWQQSSGHNVSLTMVETVTDHQFTIETMW